MSLADSKYLLGQISVVGSCDVLNFYEFKLCQLTLNPVLKLCLTEVSLVGSSWLFLQYVREFGGVPNFHYVTLVLR